ncbi:hypothetical protein DY000_02036919 [Brassica cretica]|uniref:Uncharacterized protein n=1 Tax=Brassica cretica TaxID=69181 RepID=A0ABQ7B913_BRACR|nr:hypothetical protein DY000_02036919 [Brassica cretica]
MLRFSGALVTAAKLGSGCREEAEVTGLVAPERSPPASMAKKKPPKNKASRRVPTGSTPSRSIASNSSTKASTEPASAVANQTSFVAALPEIPAPLSSTAPGGATEVDLSISVPDSSTAAAASLLKDVTVERENPSMVFHQAVAANLLSPETCANKMESPKAVILATVSNPSSVPTVSVDNNRVPILAISAVTGGSPPSSSDQLGGSQEQLQQRKSSAEIWKGKKLKTVFREVLKSVPPVSSNHLPSLPAAAPLEHHAGQSEFPLGALKPPPADIASTSKTPSNELSKITVHDLSTGSLCVDLSDRSPY